MDLYTVIGLMGVAGYVAAYTLLQLGFLDGNGVPYSVANVVAASFVLISLTQEFNLASAVIQVIWIVIGVTGLLLRRMQRRPTVYARSTHGETHVPQTASSEVRILAHTSRRIAPARSPFRAAADG